MLASIHPLGERARGQSFVVTVAAYTVGSVVAAAALGAVLGALGAAVVRRRRRRASGSASSRGAAVLAALVDRSGRRIPSWHRQVNEDWLTEYRGWVYGLGLRAAARARRRHDRDDGGGVPHVGGGVPRRRRRRSAPSSAPRSGWPGRCRVLAGGPVRTPAAIGARVGRVDAWAGRFRVVTVSVEAVAARDARRPWRCADGARSGRTASTSACRPAGTGASPCAPTARRRPRSRASRHARRDRCARARWCTSRTSGCPADRGDFGSGAVELMGDRDVFVVLFEYEPAADRRPRCSGRRASRARSTARDFDPATLRRGIAGPERAPGVLPGVRPGVLPLRGARRARPAGRARPAREPRPRDRADRPAGRPGRFVADGCLGRTVPDRGIAPRRRGRRQGRGPRDHRRRAPRARGPGARRRWSASAARSRRARGRRRGHRRARSLAVLVAVSYLLFTAFVLVALGAATCRSGRAGASGRSTRRRASLHVVVNLGAVVAAVGVAAGDGTGIGDVLAAQPLAGVPFLLLVAVGDLRRVHRADGASRSCARCAPTRRSGAP